MPHMDVDRVRWLREQVGVAANAIRDPNAAGPEHQRGGGTRDPATMATAGAFGNTASAGLCHSAWQDTAAEAVTAIGYLRGSLEADYDRLEGIIGIFNTMDDTAADGICATGVRSHTLGVYNTHLDSKSGERREAQAQTAVDHIAPTVAPAIYTGDFNTERPPAMDELMDQGWYDASRDEDGELIGTSHSGRAIDRIFAGPGVTVVTAAEPVDGASSDHDGLVVDLAVAPAWP